MTLPQTPCSPAFRQSSGVQRAAMVAGVLSRENAAVIRNAPSPEGCRFPYTFLPGHSYSRSWCFRSTTGFTAVGLARRDPRPINGIIFEARPPAAASSRSPPPP